VTLYSCDDTGKKRALPALVETLRRGEPAPLQLVLEAHQPADQGIVCAGQRSDRVGSSPTGARV